jgi:CheY-like chemotaxis protein
MSHEIRTPLNCIVGFLEVIKNEKDKNKINEYVDIIENESNKLMELINQLLDLSRIEAGKLEIKNLRFNIIEAVLAIHSTFSRRAMQHGLDFETHISKDVPAFVIGDSLRLRQVIINLVGNAIKFTNEGMISMRVSIQKETDTEKYLYFEITDTGIGITRENQKVIFNPFVQVEDSLTRKFSGSGLGTAISKQLVTMMGGDIGVESQVGKGSTFWFTIQCKKCTQEPEKVTFTRAKKLTENQEQTLQRSTILLVDDYPINRKAAGIHLKSLGCKIDYAENGRIAVEMFSKAHYDLILMDIQMPEMDGLEAAGRIRALPGGREIPIIAMTAIAYDDDIKLFKENNMDDVITKPFTKHDFRKTVVYWLIYRKKNGEE